MENRILQVPYHMMDHGYGGSAGEGCSSFFPGVDAGAAASAAGFIHPTLPWCLPSIRSISNLDQADPEFFSPHLPPLASPMYGDVNSSTRILAGLQSYGDVGLSRFLRAQQGSAASSLFGTIHAELGKLSAQEIMDAKALAASKSHSEAERRRRERINGHLAKLRSMLPNTTKTDKASLLAEVIHHVKELKRQTSEIAEESPLPSEADELTVDSTCDEDGKFVVRASMCCDDRPDLLPDLISAVKALRVRLLKAEITTVGGRVKNVLVIAGAGGSEEDDDRRHDLMAAIQDGLRAVVEQTAKHGAPSAGGSKRQRTTSLAGIIEQSSM